MRIRVERLELTISEPVADPRVFAVDVAESLADELGRHRGRLPTGRLDDLVVRIPTRQAPEPIARAVAEQLRDGSGEGS